MRSSLMTLMVVLMVAGTVAQDMAPDTVLSLNDVTITSSRISRFAKGQYSRDFDSLSRTQVPAGSLSEILNGLTTAYVRNYGQGTLATLSLRGTSANHTGIFWNGIRISPPNIGYVDLSLVQGIFFRDVSLLYGGASPMFGSGAIAGSLHLSTRPVFDTSSVSLTSSLSAGNFSTCAAEGSLGFSGARYYSRTAYTVAGSANDFSYRDLMGDRQRSEHSSYFRGGFLQDFALKLRHQQYIMASAWFQYGDREIPPTLTESGSGATQMDRSWRSMLNWKDYNDHAVYEARLAYFNEFTRFEDPLAQVYSVIRSQTAAASFEGTWALSAKSNVLAGAQYTFEFADLNAYADPKDQQTLALYASFNHDFTALKWQFSLNGRQEFLSGYHSPFLFSAGFEGRIWKDLSGRLSFSRNFRAPTLNERFWQPGGNAELEPEKSWNFESGLSFKRLNGDNSTGLGATVFSSMVSGWILWLPGAGFWSVENAQDVWSRGFEFTGDYRLETGKFELRLSGSYSYTLSTNQVKQSEFDDSYHKQLIYTPVHRALIRPGAGFKGYSIEVRGNFTGLSYTTKDNTGSLPGYFLLDAVLSKNWPLKDHLPLTIQVNLNNILNKEYQVVPYRPMPGFNFLVTLRVAVSGQQSAVSSQQSAVSSQQSLNTKH